MVLRWSSPNLSEIHAYWNGEFLKIIDLWDVLGMFGMGIQERGDILRGDIRYGDILKGIFFRILKPDGGLLNRL